MRVGLAETTARSGISIGATVGFLPAIFLATTNLNTPVIPILSIALVGLGASLGNRSLSNNKGRQVDGTLALVGLVLSVPALLFVSASLMKYEFGVAQPFDMLFGLLASAQRRQMFNLISPFVFLGALPLAWQ